MSVHCPLSVLSRFPFPFLTEDDVRAEMHSLVITRLALIRELLQDPPKCSHARTDIALLVLCYSSLDVREDEIAIEGRGFVIVRYGFVEFLHYEVDYMTKNCVGQRCKRRLIANMR